MTRQWKAALAAVILTALVSGVAACAARRDGSTDNGSKARDTTSQQSGSQSGSRGGGGDGGGDGGGGNGGGGY